LIRSTPVPSQASHLTSISSGKSSRFLAFEWGGHQPAWGVQSGGRAETFRKMAAQMWVCSATMFGSQNDIGHSEAVKRRFALT